jgi:hypothetical protein
MGVLSAILALLAISATGGSTPAPPAGSAAGLAAVRPGAISAGTRFLSSDLLEGRGTGTRGHAVAASWVATQMQALGLEPAAPDGRYEQVVPLRAWRVDPDASSIVLHGPALAPTALLRGVDFVTLSNGEHADVELDGALAFVGYAVSAPEFGYDDLKGVDLTGKIAVVLWGAPSSDRPNFFPPAPRAAHADRLGKMRRLAARGAAGVLFVYTPEAEESLPFEDFVRNARAEGMGWVEGARLGDAVDGLPARAVLSVRGLERVAVAAGVPGGARAILEKAEANRLAAQAWPLKARIRSAAELRSASSANVLGLLRGSDPGRAGETVVVLAHADGLGVGEPVGSDAVYNGAMDNAIGVAVLLEVARAFVSLPVRPARSVLFAVVTGEEQGLVGSSFLASHPVVDATGIVAVLNVDGAPTAFPFEDAVARGAEHSTLARPVGQAAEALGIPLSPDPAPRSGAFVRSDQWSFVRQGVPSLFVTPGWQGLDEQELERRRAWIRERYHTPRDEWDPAWRWEDAARFARLQFLTAYLVAADPARPAWNAGDFFERFARPPPRAR